MAWIGSYDSSTLLCKPRSPRAIQRIRSPQPWVMIQLPKPSSNSRFILHFVSKLYLSHPDRACKLSHRTDSSGSCINSMILVFNPNFSNWVLFSGTSLTRAPTSLHAIARTCLSCSQDLPIISASFRSNSPFSCSRILREFSAQNVGLRWGGDQRRCPEFTSAAYSSNVVCVFVYSSSISFRFWRSSTRSWSVRWRPVTFWRRAGRRASTAAGSKDCLFVDKILYNDESRSLVVFSFGESRSSCVYRGITSYSLQQLLVSLQVTFQDWLTPPNLLQW